MFLPIELITRNVQNFFGSFNDFVVCNVCSVNLVVVSSITLSDILINFWSQKFNFILRSQLRISRAPYSFVAF